MKQENDEETVEHFVYQNQQPTIMSTVTMIIWTVITLIAIYYSFIIYKGFNLGGFLLAFLFSPIYLLWGIYKIGIPPTVKINKRK